MMTTGAPKIEEIRKNKKYLEKWQNGMAEGFETASIHGEALGDGPEAKQGHPGPQLTRLYTAGGGITKP